VAATIKGSREFHTIGLFWSLAGIRIIQGGRWCFGAGDRKLVFRPGVRAAEDVGAVHTGFSGARDGKLVFSLVGVGSAQGVKSLAW